MPPKLNEYATHLEIQDSELTERVKRLEKVVNDMSLLRLQQFKILNDNYDAFLDGVKQHNDTMGNVLELNDNSN